MLILLPTSLIFICRVDSRIFKRPVIRNAEHLYGMAQMICPYDMAHLICPYDMGHIESLGVGGLESGISQCRFDKILKFLLVLEPS